MSATRRLPMIAGIATAGAALAAFAAFNPGGALTTHRLWGWRAIGLIFALVNLKALPFMWHVRLFRALIYHFYIQTTPVPPSALFQPVITSSHAPLYELDYNLHKSNSTYFSDLDISRTHLISCLLKKGIQAASRDGREAGKHAEPRGEQGNDNGDGGGNGSFSIHLGAVSCHFKREIKPYEKYEIWTRLLSWDRKWLYLVSHIVRPDAMPGRLRNRYTLQPWLRNAEGADTGKATLQLTPAEREKLEKGIFATSIAKYVVKRGRLTIAPEKVLERSGLLPQKSTGIDAGTLGNEKNTFDNADGTGLEGHARPEKNLPDTDQVIVDATESVDDDAGKSWTWEAVERKRQKGILLAEHFSALDGLHNVFVDNATEAALGRFADLW